MPGLDASQLIQEAEYTFPYHYIPQSDQDQFSVVRSLRWGYEYLSYLHFALDIVRQLPCRSLLDVGCGDGRFLHEARQALDGVELAGVDFSERAIAYARAFNPGLPFYCADLAGVGRLGEGFSVVTLIETLEHIPPEAMPGFVQGVHAQVQPGGHLVVTVPSQNVPMNPKHYQHFAEASLAEALGPNFKLLHCTSLNRNSSTVRWVERLLMNRFYIICEHRLVDRLYRAYVKHYLRATVGDGRRLCAVFSRSEPA